VAGKINLSIAATARGRVAIAAHIAVSLYTNFRFPEGSRLIVAMGYGNTDLGGLSTPRVVGQKKFHFGFGNPAGLARMAFLGRGPYRTKLPLRAIGVFPSWDRLIFAVHKDTGIESIEDIKAKRYPLHISSSSGAKFQTVSYIIDELLKGYGFSFLDVEKWGGKILRCSRPGGEERKEHIRSRKANAVFDEGLKSWGDSALESGMNFLPMRADVLQGMEKLGFPSAPVTRATYSNLERETNTLDFSGWTFFCHRDLSQRMAYKMTEAIDLCHPRIPVDHFDRRPMTMEEFCRGGEGGPLTIPFHPGAKKYYREKGYL